MFSYDMIWYSFNSLDPTIFQYVLCWKLLQPIGKKGNLKNAKKPLFLQQPTNLVDIQGNWLENQLH